MPNTALITGASSGIGMEFARYHASKGGDVILTARRKDTLDALAAEVRTAHGVNAHVVALDLGAEGGAQALYDHVKEAGLTVDILINNAGFGGQGRFLDRELAKDLAMIDLNVKALVTLTHCFAADMVSNGGGRILNVASTAGFMPGPLQATYFATKAFVTSFSQAIDQEYRKRGLTCTALCPGYVKTEFADVSDLNGTDLVSKGGATPDDVARHGYEAMMRGALVTVNEAKLGFMVNWIIPLLPRRAVLKTVQRMQTKK
ncbi:MULTISPECIES: SDR family NAD(P)-dependent oxidoreductase [Roseobacteraceae]|uniref:Sulfoacetaldehyde reductase 2 n=1 Tax=Pseudosulfitobacter pseudonitzschiae TaxID=1402135 RepID=A0A221K3F2_9RHOB|nr:MULTISPECIES: SDR family oxidoreductase [Roseobacteraceae]ASM73519.1 sulfoacetaldehyde reductase 2 [Pseudosulfitobacter pseudonitzschiae]